MTSCTKQTGIKDYWFRGKMKLRELKLGKGSYGMNISFYNDSIKGYGSDHFCSPIFTVHQRSPPPCRVPTNNLKQRAQILRTSLPVNVGEQ